MGPGGWVGNSELMCCVNAMYKIDSSLTLAWGLVFVVQSLCYMLDIDWVGECIPVIVWCAT